jgi:hypothetical protein
MQKLIALLLTFSVSSLWAQYPPAAGKPGSTAIHKDSGQFVAWANTCEIRRGPQNILHPDSATASFGFEDDAVGLANGAVVSLGDGGYATLSFNPPITNGPGFDFAVFENAFSDTYLELAFVEVSSDGLNFVRFPAYSNTDTANQVGSFGNIDPTKIHNFAGKYRVFWGTPFDLEELKDSAGVNIYNITHVKIIDVVGSIQDSIARRDSRGFKVNDPFPTDFESGGFDLDAVGVINNTDNFTSYGRVENAMLSPQIYPNPSIIHKEFRVTASYKFKFNIVNVYGNQIVVQQEYKMNHAVKLSQSGTFFLKWSNENGTMGTIKIVIQ